MRGTTTILASANESRQASNKQQGSVRFLSPARATSLPRPVPAPARVPHPFASVPAGNLDWSPLSLSHWWARVLPALAQHHHHHHTATTTAPSSLFPSRAPPPRAAPPDGGGVTISRAAWGGGNGSSGSGSTSREGSPAGGAQLVVGSLDQLALVSALGKEISPQMVQALQAVASRRESFSSAAKLYSVSVTTLWRYYRKLGLSDSSTPK